MLTVCVQISGQDAGGVRRFQHDRPGAITKQHAGGAVSKVKNARKHFGTNDQRFPGRAGLDHGVGNRERINEPAAHGLHVKCRASIGPQLVLQNAGRRGKHHVRRRGGHDDQIDICSRQASCLQRCARGLQTQITAANLGRGKMTRPNSGTTNNPFIGSFHTVCGQFRSQIGIGQSTGWKVAASSGDTRENFH